MSVFGYLLELSIPPLFFMLFCIGFLVDSSQNCIQVHLCTFCMETMEEQWSRNLSKQFSNINIWQFTHAYHLQPILKDTLGKSAIWGAQQAAWLPCTGMNFILKYCNYSVIVKYKCRWNLHLLWCEMLLTISKNIYLVRNLELKSRNPYASITKPNLGIWGLILFRVKSC